MHERLEALGLVGHAPGAGNEGNRAERGGQLVDAAPDIPLERERRVLETPLEDADVARPDDGRVAAVRDERKGRAAEREVALVGLHRGHDHSFGQREKALVEAPLEDDRALGEVDDLVEDARRIAPAADPIELGDDRPSPLGCVGLDSRAAQHLRVRGCF